MDLLCAEELACDRLGSGDQALPTGALDAPAGHTAACDAVIFEDLRVLHNLLELETVYVPECNYFVVVQKDILPYMRKVVSTWMLEVCEEQQCEDQVFPLAVNFLDRFLCACAISRKQLQLAAAVCLLLASKIRQCHALGVDLLCFYSDHSIVPDELRRWELLVLSKLHWNVTAVTGFDYVDHVLERVSWTRRNATVRRHAHTLVALCYTEPELIQTAPSLLATASICAAVRGLNLPWACTAVSRACQLTRVSASAAERVVLHIERLVASEAAALVGGNGGMATDAPPSPLVQLAVIGNAIINEV
ncbi:G1/S-specific cyclin-D2-like [Thrips palmi]|uniref:G1/S-specific cyclin-D2-like n=1 Tax=Thrips palmi TaxID=161013 RepID=A0A6P8ZBC8_THRPL|nr:G1/S-specific cyclin-D2-like [Thrips palmi]